MSKPFILSPRRKNDEADGQRHVVKMLRAYVPDGVWWSASISGVKLPPHTAAEAKRMGMERGMPDFIFIFRDGVSRFVEMKTLAGSLTPEQQHVERLVGRHNFKVCRTYPGNHALTWGEFKTALTAWMAPLGVDWLTERESLQREAARRRAA
jgi:hypothetical protein